MSIDKKLSPVKCIIVTGDSDFTMVREDGTSQRSQGFGSIDKAFPDVHAPACTLPTSATVEISPSPDQPRLVGAVSRAESTTAHFQAGGSSPATKEISSTDDVTNSRRR